MAVCKTCGTKYSKWAAPVSAGGLCGDCFETVLNAEQDVHPEELPSAAIVPAETRKVRIRLTSFIPRTRSKLVFAFVMSCYCLMLSSVIGAWTRALGIKPPRAFYLSGGIGDVIGLLVVAPILESLVLNYGVGVGATGTRAPERSSDRGSIIRQLSTCLALVGARGDCAAQLLHSGGFLSLLASNFLEGGILGRCAHSRPEQHNSRCQRGRSGPTGRLSRNVSG
jgi:hypothetical protein